MNRLVIIIVFLMITGCGNAVAQDVPRANLAHTFSIVARDTVTGEMAVGVQSHWFSVGTLVSWGKSGVGVVATQSFVNPALGPDGLKLMEDGKSAGVALKVLIEADEGREFRQVAFLDNKGSVSAWTGGKCIESAGHQTGNNYSVQANMMLNDRVVPAMARAFEENSHLPLAERVVKVLQIAQEAGGDIRGKQSAAMFPDNLEMKYWKAVAMANNNQVAESLPIFREIFRADLNWKELTRRLPAPGLLTVSPADLKRIFDL